MYRAVARTARVGARYPDDMKRMGLLLMVMLAGCGSKREPAKEKGAASVETTADLSTLVSGTTVTLPEEVGKLAFGAPQGTEPAFVISKKFSGVTYNLEYSNHEKRLEKIEVTTNKPLEPILTKQWGPPVKTKNGTAFWFDPKSGVRAWLPSYGKGTRVAFSRYDALDKLLGPPGFDLAFAAGKPLLGATLDELSTAWGSALCDFVKAGPQIKQSLEDYRTTNHHQWYDQPHVLRLCLPQPRYVDESVPYGDMIYVGRMGKVESAVLTFRTDGAEPLTKDAIAVLDAKFGKPELITTASGTKERWYFDLASHRKVVAAFSDESFALTISRYSAIAEWLAADKPGALSIATKSMPVGTPAAIGKEDPEHFNPHGELPQLVFPGSDYSTAETEVELSSMAHEPKTYGYHTMIPFTDNEPAGDAIFALLETKFGHAKPDPDQPSTATGKFYLWRTKDGQKVSGWRVSQQWQITVTR